jgi:hypothetical protein
MNISRGFELRDVGNCAIPEAILNKQGKLSDHEWKVIQSHTIVGERILNSIPALRPVAEIVRHSHERHDGGGYPDGLAAEAIPVGSRLVAIAAAFDAMISDRPFRPALSFKEAVHELGSSAGTQFDPRAISAFCQALDTTADAIQQNTAVTGTAPEQRPIRGNDGAVFAPAPGAPTQPAAQPQPAHAAPRSVEPMPARPAPVQPIPQQPAPLPTPPMQQPVRAQQPVASRGTSPVPMAQPAPSVPTGVGFTAVTASPAMPPRPSSQF